MNILEMENLSKGFGEHHIIKNLSFAVPENTIYGFLGQNGAGKTTTMKMVLGLLKPTSGRISVCGEDVTYGETKTNRHIGFLPDVPEFYGYMKPMEYLSLCGEVAGIDRKKVKLKSEELLSLVGLDRADKRISGFSRGMKQRLGIAQALLAEPKLLICDEPTSALDPVGRKEILDILLSVKGKITVIFSTHILSDVERICDHAAILHKGSLVINGTLSQLKQSYPHDTLQIEFCSVDDLKRFTSDDSIRMLFSNAECKECTVTLKSNGIDKAVEQVYHAVSATKIYPAKIEILEPTLEHLFMEVVK